MPIQWEEGDAAQLPIDDESIDVVLSQLTLSFVGDKAGAAREIRRVLAPGGRAVINVAGAIQPLNQEMADALARHIDPNLAGFLDVVFSMADPDQTAALLRDAGLSDVRASVEEHRFQLPPPAEFLWGYVAAKPLLLFVADTAPEAAVPGGRPTGALADIRQRRRHGGDSHRVGLRDLSRAAGRHSAPLTAGRGCERRGLSH